MFIACNSNGTFAFTCADIITIFTRNKIHRAKQIRRRVLEKELSFSFPPYMHIYVYLCSFFICHATAPPEHQCSMSAIFILEEMFVVRFCVTCMLLHQIYFVIILQSLVCGSILPSMVGLQVVGLKPIVRLWDLSVGGVPSVTVFLIFATGKFPISQVPKKDCNKFV